ncbi:MAG: SPOR domain-containing protein [Proteobacteria bacterium]|nr:SPOR domain-containing protein [Pseudomonadota bacterium]MBU1398861.1 SPOR domain-containing protein [Pseudomonadota bacterium]MBU1571196.1 SPOR domain-containing protein [Pseudomonadota bacterium]
MFIFGKEKNAFVDKKLLEKKPFIELSRKKALLWLLGVFFICGWMFVLGILVGRGTAPVQFDIENLKKDIKEELKAAIEKEKEEKKAAESNTTGQTSSDGKQNLEFYEDLKSTKDTTGSIKMDKGDINEVPLKEPGPVKVPEPVKVPDKTVIEPVITKEIAAPEPPLTEKVSGPVFTVQTSSGKDKKGVEKTVKTLINKGYPAYMTMSEIPGKGTWYRVRVGEFKDKKEAEKVLSRLGKDKIKGIIVTKGN